MYLRHTTRKKDGKVHRYWSLVRSVRVGRWVIQQAVVHLGELDEQGCAASPSPMRLRPRCSIASASCCPSACAVTSRNCRLSPLSA
jgi:hypothetical protein